MLSVSRRALASQGKLADARTILQTLLDGAPDDSAAWTDLGRIRLTAGDVGDASVAAARGGAGTARALRTDAAGRGDP
ncbi:tetratricopeptide repeat protein [Sphingomonas sp. LR55]|uniref:tetratricopeptide repeat protein n=1 Tax=Sphingomonas sp. LR55 TaxID=3050231 RepID=UPI002FE115B2